MCFATDSVVGRTDWLYNNGDTRKKARTIKGFILLKTENGVTKIKQPAKYGLFGYKMLINALLFDEANHEQHQQCPDNGGENRT